MTDAQRDEALAAFLGGTAWRGAALDWLPADASTRRYARLRGGPSPALLMDAPPAREAAVCLPGMDGAARRALGYNAEARLAGSDLSAFAGLSDWLRGAGVRAPEVFAADEAAGLAVLEDLGAGVLAEAAADPAAEAAGYEAAVDVLIRLAKTPPPGAPLRGWSVQTYDDAAMRAEVRLLTAWWVPFAGGAPASEEAVRAYEAAWDEVLARLGPCDTLVLRDYHAENLLVLPEGGVGVIDFQDALVGRSAYDLASLLEDARRDVPPALEERLYERFASRRPDRARFETDYAVLAAQRNAKILGIFARLIRRDGKPRYEAFLPRVRAHFARDLARAPLAPVASWAARFHPELLHG